LELIDEILDFSETESGHFELEREPVALVDMPEDMPGAPTSLGEAKRDIEAYLERC
jgi:hypothetical protein